MRIHISSIVMVVPLALLGAVLHAQQSTGTGPAHDAFGGIWVNAIDGENSPSTAPPAGPDNGAGGRRTGGGGGRGGYGGRGGGGFGGGGFGGGRGGFGGRRAGGGDNDQAAQAAAQALFTRELLDPVKQMTIVVKPASVSIVTDEGHVTELTTNKKKVSETAENGFIKYNRTTYWDGPALVSEIAIKDGPTFEQRYELAADGNELHVATSRKASKSNGRGNFGGFSSTRPTTHVYTRPPASGAAAPAHP
jgi:hypothetical protein